MLGGSHDWSHRCSKIYLCPKPVRPGSSTALLGMPTLSIGSSVCPKCGNTKKSGKRSCCAQDGTWFNTCGNSGDTEFEHTWAEGIQACRGDAELCTVCFYAHHYWTRLLCCLSCHCDCLSTVTSADRALNTSSPSSPPSVRIPAMTLLDTIPGILV